MAANENPLGFTDRFRSHARQLASDPLLLEMIRIAHGEVDSVRVRVEVPVNPPTEKRAHELAYSAGWFRDEAGQWLPGPGANPRRLVHRIDRTILSVSPQGFEVLLSRRSATI